MSLVNCISKRYCRIFLIIFLIFITDYSFASASEEEGHAKKDKDVGTIIMEHIGDSYNWHWFSVGDFHAVVPLPIIIYYDGNLDVFLSSKFNHGHDSYKGYRIAEEGPKKDKIIRVLDDGITPDENAGFMLDISITKNVTAIFISVILLCLIFLSVAKSYKKRAGKAPKGMQSFLEPVVLFVRDQIAIPSIGKEKYQKYLPFLLTVFFFIFLNNLLGLIPIAPFGANVTGNIAVTMVLALFTFIITTINGNKAYWKHIINAPGVPWWLKFPIPLMPIVELIGVFTKPIVLMIRLFANILAGHIIAIGFICLIFIFGKLGGEGLGYAVSPISVLLYIFMELLELLVAFIQAYVFTLLSALFFGMATEEHH